MSRTRYVGPVTGREYNLDEGDRIDPVVEGIGCTEDKSSPAARVNGRTLYRRIFIRLRTPQEHLHARLSRTAPILPGVRRSSRTGFSRWYAHVISS